MPAVNPDEAATRPSPNETPGAAKRTARSRVSNGRELFLADIDQRSILARRFRDILTQLVSDLGGDPSEAQSIICRRAATLAVWTEQTEAIMAAGQAIDIGPYTTACNSLRRLLADLGLERRMEDVGSLSLRDRLMRARAAGKSGGAPGAPAA